MHAGPLNLIKIKSTLIDVQCTQVGEVSIHNYLYCIRQKSNVVVVQEL